MKKLMLVATVASCVAVSGCKKSDKGEEKKGGEAAEARKPAEGRAPAEPARPAAPKLVDVDLSSRGAAWKGYSVKGPAGSKVMEDLGNVRVAGKGEFDLILSQKKVDFASFKKNKGIGVKRGKGTLTFPVDKPDMLEWKAVFPKYTTYGFRQIVDVAGKKVGCWPMHGVDAQAKLQIYRDACKTITKK